MRIEKTAITKELMRIDTRRQIIDIQQIDNRRFMYNPKTGILVLGYQYAATSTMVSSHANELADAGITKGYDDFVRGWIGTGGTTQKGCSTLHTVWIREISRCLTGLLTH